MTAYASSTNQTAAEAAHVEHLYLVSLDFPSGFLRAHSRTGNLTVGAYTYIGAGNIGGISEITEDAMLRPNGVTMQISGTDTSQVTTAMTEAYHGRAAIVYEGFLDTSTMALLAMPELIFRGIMDVMTVELGPNSATISVQCEGELARWQRHNGLMYTHESQQQLFPGDKGFDQVPLIQNRSINWIKKSQFGHSFPWARSARIATKARQPK